MSEFAGLFQPQNRVVISTSSLECCGAELGAFDLTAPAAAAWPSANLAIYIPFVVYQVFTAVKMFVLNGGTASGNVDVGIYDSEGNRLVNMGSTAQSGTSAVQSFDIADTTLHPGVYYMAMAADGTTGTYWRYVFTNPGAQAPASMGVLQQATAFALPSTATFAAMAQSYLPELVVAGRTTI